MSYDKRQLYMRNDLLKIRRIRADSLMVYKLLHDQLDISGYSVGITLSIVSTRGMDVNLVVYKARNNFMAKTFAYRVSKS